MDPPKAKETAPVERRVIERRIISLADPQGLGGR